jgi:hypothetical protein
LFLSDHDFSSEKLVGWLVGLNFNAHTQFERQKARENWDGVHKGTLKGMFSHAEI